MTQLASFAALRRSVSLLLANKANFVGVGLGLKQVEGRAIQTLAWRIYVTDKRPMTTLFRKDRMPRDLFGLPTDVIQRSPLLFSDGAVLGGGLAIGNCKGVRGTLGGLGWHLASGQQVLVSSFHVLFGKQAGRGDKIWRLDGPLRAVARNSDGKATTVRLGGQRYFIDAAIACVDPQPIKPAPTHALAPWHDTRVAHPGMRVRKRGAATGDSHGIVIDVCYPDRWHADNVSEDAPNQILVQPSHGPQFSAAGDSGAVLRDCEGQAVGLLWGCNARGETVACHIRPVVRALGIWLEPGGSS